MAISPIQRQAATGIQRSLTRRNERWESDGLGTRNIIIYFQNRQKRYVIQPRSVRLERRYEIPATMYSPKSSNWMHISSSATSDWAKVTFEKGSK